MLQFYFHLKSGETKPSQVSGSKYRTLCGHWVYDSIASDVECPDRPVTCPKCAALDPHPEWNRPDIVHAA
jgi:hypothetical protein